MDIVVRDKLNGKVYIIDISCPSDTNVIKKRKWKDFKILGSPGWARKNVEKRMCCGPCCNRGPGMHIPKLCQLPKDDPSQYFHRDVPEADLDWKWENHEVLLIKKMMDEWQNYHYLMNDVQLDLPLWLELMRFHPKICVDWCCHYGPNFCSKLAFCWITYDVDYMNQTSPSQKEKQNKTKTKFWNAFRVRLILGYQS